MPGASELTVGARRYPRGMKLIKPLVVLAAAIALVVYAQPIAAWWMTDVAPWIGGLLSRWLLP